MILYLYIFKPPVLYIFNYPLISYFFGFGYSGQTHTQKTELKPVSEYVYGNSLIARNDYKESYSRYGYASGYVTGNREYYGQDILGSTMLVTNGKAGVVQKYAYDAYGNNYEGSFAGSNNIGYNGKRYDGGTGWYDYGFRDYDSRTGRFTTVDPIRDGMNWYAYCGGDPINCVDLWGLSQESDKNKEAVNATVGNALNLDFGRDYATMAVQNFKNGHPVLATVQMIDAACEILYDAGAAYVGASYGDAAISGIVTAVETGSLTQGYVNAEIQLSNTLSRAKNAVTNVWNSVSNNVSNGFDKVKNIFTGGNSENVIPDLKNGDTVYRVYGGDSLPEGASWTTTNPSSVKNYRDTAGLPSGGKSGYNNTGRFVIEGIVEDASKCVEKRPALPLDGNNGGLPEYIIPQAVESGAVKITNVSGVNPEF